MNGSELRQFRETLGLTQKKLAEEVGVAANTVARWERAESAISESAARLVQELLARHPGASTSRPVSGIARDEYHHKILEKLEEHLDPEVFEACANALLGDIYPGLAPVSGGADSGYDGALPGHDHGQPPLITTTSKNYVQNFQKNLGTAIDKYPDIRSALFATSRSITPQSRSRLIEICKSHNIRLINIHDRDWFAQRLYHDAQWCKKLLNVTGRPSALSLFPVTRRPVIGDSVIGRQRELQHLREMRSDCLLIGEPGSGKTHLGRAIAMQGHAKFLIDNERDALASAIRDQEPEAIIVDDAQHCIEFLAQLKQLRTELLADFRIIAMSWPSARSPLMRSLEISDNRVIELEKLDRNTMAMIVESVGIKHPDLIRLILDQAVGRPGLAATMAHLCLQGSIQKVATGEALAELLSDFMTPSAGPVLAVLSFDGKQGTALKVAEDLLGISRHELLTILSELEPAGVITESGETVVVTPQDLRFVLVRDHFFGRTGLRDKLQQLQDRVPDPEEFMATLIGAQFRGARIPDLADRVRALNSEKVWAMYAQLGHDEALDAINAFKSIPESLAKSAIRNAPQQVIPVLLEQAKSDSRQIQSHPEHPLRIITDWCVNISPLDAEAVDRREVAIQTIVDWAQETGNVHTGVRAVSRVFTPEFEAHRCDPGRGDRITFTYGILSSEDLKRLGKYWPIMETILMDPKHISWQDALDMLRSWVMPTRVEPNTEQKAELNRVAEDMIKCFEKLTRTHPGLRTRISEFAQNLNIQINNESDREFEVCYPQEGAKAYLEKDSQLTRRANELANTWLEKLNISEIAERIVKIESEAQLAGLNFPRYTPIVCREIGRQLKKPIDMAFALIEKGGRADLVSILLDIALEIDIDDTKIVEAIERCLNNRDYEGVGINLAMRFKPLPERLLNEVVKHCEPWTGLVEMNCSRGSVTSESCEALLLCDNAQIRLSAAIGVLDPGEDPKMSSELVSKARLVVADANPKELRNPTVEYKVGKILAQDSELAYQWLENQIGSASASFIFDDDRIVTAAVSGLSIGQRRKLIRQLMDNRNSQEMGKSLVGEDLELYHDLIQTETSNYVRLAPLGDVHGQQWREMALIALRAGINELDVVSRSLPDHYGWVGSESEMWRSHVRRFEKFADDPEAGIRRVVSELTGVLHKRIDDASKREREVDIYGL